MIRVEKLKIFNKDREFVNLSFTIRDSLALVGESGSGKSLTLKALIDMLPNGMKKEILIDASFEFIRGDTISFIPQNPFTALSPMTKISKQWFASKERAKELFETLSLDWKIFKRYPPQLSGGELQRVIFAMALADNPKLLLLDEPTTALDPHLREEIAKLLVKLQDEFGFKILFVTHDINLAGRICKDILVIKDGRKVEEGESKKVLKSPQKQYTRRLISATFANREFRS